MLLCNKVCLICSSAKGTLPNDAEVTIKNAKIISIVKMQMIIMSSIKEPIHNAEKELIVHLVIANRESHLATMINHVHCIQTSPPLILNLHHADIFQTKGENKRDNCLRKSDLETEATVSFNEMGGHFESHLCRNKWWGWHGKLSVHADSGRRICLCTFCCSEFRVKCTQVKKCGQKGQCAPVLSICTSQSWIRLLTLDASQNS